MKMGAALDEYNRGFKKPSEDLPAFSRRSLTRATILAKVGLDALVPSTPRNCPFATMAKVVP